MKKTIYYLAPFVIVPIIFLLVGWLDNTDIINSTLSVVMVYVAFYLFPALMGSLSTTNKKFDYIMTAVIPLSFFFALFIGLFFDEGCDGTSQLSLSHALNIEYYKLWLPNTVIMAIIAFVASFKPIRISKKLCSANKESSCVSL